MKYVIEVLDELGMRADLRIVDDRTFRRGVYGGEAQGFWLGWLPGYPSANEFLSPLFECGSSFNVSGVCDEALDDQIEEARALQATDPRPPTSSGPRSSTSSSRMPCGFPWRTPW